MSASWHPRVTAMLPSYNGEAFIQRTLDSLAAQTWDNLEILIADDCSTDRTPQIVADFAAGHANVRLLRVGTGTWAGSGTRTISWPMRPGS